VLEIAEHLGEIGRPAFQLLVIAGPHDSEFPKHSCGRIEAVLDGE
jgi:hypothetical protein